MHSNQRTHSRVALESIYMSNSSITRVGILSDAAIEFVVDMVKLNGRSKTLKRLKDDISIDLSSLVDTLRHQIAQGVHLSPARIRLTTTGENDTTQILHNGKTLSECGIDKDTVVHVKDLGKRKLALAYL